MVNKNLKGKFIRVSTLAALLILIGFLVSQSLGLFATGFDSAFVLQQYSFYLSGAVFLVGLLLLIFTEFAISEGDKKYGDSLAFNSSGEPPSINIPFIKNPFALFFLSIGIVSILMLVSVFTQQTAFTEFASLEQQFSPTNELLYSALLIPIAENLGLAFVIGLLIFGVRHIARRTKMNTGAFILTSLILIILISGAYGVINHTLRYGDSDVALISVFFFWSISGLLTILSGSFIPAWLLHVGNNTTFSLIKTMTQEQLLAPFLIVALISFAIYGVILFTSRGRKR